MTVYELFKKADFNVIAEEIAKKDNDINFDNRKSEAEKDEMRKKEQAAILKAREEMLKVPFKEEPNNIIVCVKCVDLKYKETFLDATMAYQEDILNKELYIPDLDDPNANAPDLNDFADKYVELYAFDFCSWEEILGSTVADASIAEYGAEAVAEAVFEEMTFFGLDYTRANDRKEDIKQGLLESVEELKENPYQGISLDELYDKYGFERPTEEERKENERIWKEEHKINQAERIKIMKRIIENVKRDEVVVVGFDSAGMIAAVSRVCREIAQSTAKQLRTHYPSVRCMTHEEFCVLQDKESEERAKYNGIG